MSKRETRHVVAPRVRAALKVGNQSGPVASAPTVPVAPPHFTWTEGGKTFGDDWGGGV
jgi:hypothetical protein